MRFPPDGRIGARMRRLCTFRGRRPQGNALTKLPTTRGRTAVPPIVLGNPRVASR
jgi:hypothetical protein